MDEKQLMEKRNKNEESILAFFAKYGLFIYEIVHSILLRLEKEQISELEAMDLVLFELSGFYYIKRSDLDNLIADLVENQYTTGLEFVDEDTDLSLTDIATMALLYRVMRRFVSRAERQLLRDSMANVRARRIFSQGYVEERFDKIVVSEGTRQIGRAIVLRSKEAGFHVRFVTARDERVCPICIQFDGDVFHPLDVWNFLPRHPNCRCYFVVAE